ncbi:hypothetical protein GCM10018952_56270 [Streptosporangium vulgare]
MHPPSSMRPSTSSPRPLSGLASLIGAPSGTSRAPLAAVSGITIDSRQVRRGDLYVALPGSTAHGADFSAQALAAGASAILTDEAGRRAAVATGLPVLVVPDPRALLGQVSAWVYGNPVADVMVIGVTGTSGKSTVTFLLEAGLRAAGHSPGLVGGVEIHVGELRFTPKLTTPEASDLQGLFALMRERGVTAAAMEVSSHALALGRVDGVFYDVALFTNLSQDHLDFHRDLDDYFATKARLFTPEMSRVGVVNIDDAHGRELLGIAKIPMTTFSAEGAVEADWRAVDVRLGPEGSAFTVVGPGGVEEAASVALPGPSTCPTRWARSSRWWRRVCRCGPRWRASVRWRGSPAGWSGSRAARTSRPSSTTRTNPARSSRSCAPLREVTEGRLIVVLGCGGDRDRGKRPMMGEAAARLADVAILTSDNPRSEDPLRILAEMMDGVLGVSQDGRAHVIIEPDRAAAIDLAVGRAGPGDVVVVAGKGHEQGQYVGDQVLPFDDRQVVADAIGRRRDRTGRRSTYGE